MQLGPRRLQTIGSFFGEWAGEAASECEDIPTSLLLGNPRWNLAWNLEGPTDRLRPPGLPSCVPKRTRTGMPTLRSHGQIECPTEDGVLCRTFLLRTRAASVSSVWGPVVPPPLPRPHPSRILGPPGSTLDVDNEVWGSWPELGPPTSRSLTPSPTAGRHRERQVGVMKKKKTTKLGTKRQMPEALWT